MPITSTENPERQIAQSEIPLTTNSHTSGTTERRVILWSWLVVVICGFLQAVADRFYMNPDGTSYADLADAYIRGDWHSAISAYWSPLYPFLLSVTFSLFHPSPYFESTIIHLLNFVLYLGCFAALQLFIFEIAKYRPFYLTAFDELRFSRPSLLVLGTVTFLIATQDYLPLSLVTPDLCVAALALLAAAAILRLERLGRSHARLIGLGIILGAGYLAKAAFFPIAFVFMAAALATKGHWRTIFSQAIILLVAFFAIAGPNIFAISKTRRSLTFADTGKLNYIWFVNGAFSAHFEHRGNAQGVQTHPTRKIFANPNVYEFATPIGGTYPVWFDPSYWHDGLHPKFDLEQQLTAFGSTSNAYRIMFLKAAWFYFAWLILAILQHTCGISLLKNLREYWRIAIPSLAALAAYWFVYVEGRYIAGFTVILWTVLFASIRLPIHAVSQRILKAAVIALVVATGIALYPQFSHDVEFSSQPLPNLHWEVARALHKEFGLRDGDPVGCIGNCFYAYWARLGKLKIVTEIPGEQAYVFRSSDAVTQFAALQSMARTGAQVVVTKTNVGKGWKPVGQTDYFAYDLRSQAPSPSSR
jgi:hypothetical protein